MFRYPFYLFVLVGILNIYTACDEKKDSVSIDTTATTNKTSKPNIIYIIADDLGYGDLSCYGQKKFVTPNIDRLAEEGMRFTQHYSGSTVCAPSRSVLMTGLHSGHTFIRGNKEVQPEGQYPLPLSTFTIAESLRNRGYTTGAFGKWGLGYPGSDGDPLHQGFDRFYGYNCQRLGHHYYPHHLWDDNGVVVLEGNTGKQQGVYAPTLIHQETLNFIRENKDRPFFLYVPSIIPHAELAAPPDLMAKNKGKYLPEKSYQGIDDGPNFRKGPYQSQSECHAAFVSMIELLDQQVGEIMNEVEQLGISENTIIIFTSDNGPHKEGGADPDYFDSNGPFRGYKRDLYEGGIRVPMIAKWQGQIAAGSTTDHLSAFWDVFPTLTELSGAQILNPIDGISFLPTLLGNHAKQKKHKHLYWEFHEKGGRIAVRKGKWKAVKYDFLANPNGPFELYDLEIDPGETNDLAASYPQVALEMTELHAKSRTPSEVFSFGEHIAVPLKVDK